MFNDKKERKDKRQESASTILFNTAPRLNDFRFGGCHNQACAAVLKCRKCPSTSVVRQNRLVS